MESSNYETKDIGLCNTFDETKNEKSYISNQGTLTSLNAIR